MAKWNTHVPRHDLDEFGILRSDEIAKVVGNPQELEGIMTPDCLWINGPFGVGKTTLADLLSEDLGFPIFDPEEIGFVVRVITDSVEADFQDLQSWRRGVTAVASGLVADIGNAIIMPMTVYRSDVRSELRVHFRDAGVAVQEVVLTADARELERRLRSRMQTPSALEWGLQHITPSLAAFTADHGDLLIDTTIMRPEDIVPLVSRSMSSVPNKASTEFTS